MPDRQARREERISAERDGLVSLLDALVARSGGELVRDVRLDAAKATISFVRGSGAAADRDSIALSVAEFSAVSAGVLTDPSHIVLPAAAGRPPMELLLDGAGASGCWSRAVLLRGTAAGRQAPAPDRDARWALTIAHELRQPLFTIGIAAERLRILLERADPSKAESAAALARIATQVERAQIIIARTLGQGDPAGADPVPDRRADVCASARNAVDFLREMTEAADISVQARLDACPAWVALDSVGLEQVFVNVLRNGIEAIQSRREQGRAGAGRIAVEVICEGRTVRARVTDNGSGIGRETDCGQSGGNFVRKRGFGLGLSICREILAGADGFIQLRPRGEGGTIVEITIPLAEAGLARMNGTIEV